MMKKTIDDFHKLRREIDLLTDNSKIKSIPRNHWKLFSLKQEKISNKKIF